MAAEEEAARAAARKRRLGIAAGIVAGIAAVALLAVFTVGRMGGDDRQGASDPARSAGQVAIPAVRTRELAPATRAAGCRLRSFRPGPADAQHIEGKGDYRHNPPVFGAHNQTPSSDGNYVGQGTPAKENLVHALEHSRVIIWYRPDVGERRIGQLETLFAEPIPGKPSGFDLLLVQNQTQMPFAVAATAWGQQLGCPRFTDKTFDALRAFRASYVGKGPENAPFPE